MTTQQLEYVLAVDKFRHFANAAEACFVTQPTLSMMIQKLEDELEIKIFDRTKHPVTPTAIGEQIIVQARIALNHFRQIREIVDAEKNTAKGEFRLGIIPTIAPYLVPEMLQQHQNYKSEIELTIKEHTTTILINEVVNENLDGGIIAGPIDNPDIVEYPLYYEKFYAYVSPTDYRYNEPKIDLNHVENLWLLENVHCFRGQIERLCKEHHQPLDSSSVFESGSIGTLINVVDLNSGITIIPEMYAMALDEEKQTHLREFKDITAVREVSIIVNKEYLRKTMLNIIIDIIRKSVPESMQNPELKKYLVKL
jgi:LysR family hydrogen peroxide-inducible transcriptional activator